MPAITIILIEVHHNSTKYYHNVVIIMGDKNVYWQNLNVALLYFIKTIKTHHTYTRKLFHLPNYQHCHNNHLTIIQYLIILGQISLTAYKHYNNDPLKNNIRLLYVQYIMNICYVQLELSCYHPNSLINLHNLQNSNTYVLIE